MKRIFKLNTIYINAINNYAILHNRREIKHKSIEKINIKLFNCNRSLGEDCIKTRNVLKLCSHKIACIYLITFGYVKNLRDSMNIDESINDTSIVCKYGYTNNLERRIYEHNNTYGDIDECIVRLKYYSLVDKTLLSTAETYIRNYFLSNDSIHRYKNYKEIVIISKNDMKKVKNYYVEVSENHIIDIQQLKNKK
jgi:hypothetical protein